MPRPIDHLVIASRDLGAAAAAYRRLGFLVGARNQHPWGTENHIVQLDGAFLELIGIGREAPAVAEDDPAAPFANAVQAYLGRREGLALLALASTDAAEDAKAFAAAGSGPPRTMTFSRTAEGQDGRRREVSFSLAFAPESTGRGLGFFACQHHRPENFWSPAAQRHPNTAQRLLGVVLMAGTPAAEAARLRVLLGPDAVREDETGLHVSLDAGQVLDVLTPARVRAAYGEAATLAADADGGAAVFRIGVGSFGAVRRFINVMGSPYALIDNRLVVPPRIGKGIALSFEQIEDRHAAPS